MIAISRGEQKHGDMASSSQNSWNLNNVVTKGYRIPSLWPGVQLLGQPGGGADSWTKPKRDGYMKTYQQWSNPKKAEHGTSILHVYMLLFPSLKQGKTHQARKVSPPSCWSIIRLCMFTHWSVDISTMKKHINPTLIAIPKAIHAWFAINQILYPA